MSELIQKNDNRQTIRWKLLTSASAAALIFSACGASEAATSDSDRPQLWIELGGQFEQLANRQEIYNPSFMPTVTRPNLLSALDVQSPARFSLGEDAKLSFQPEDSDWDFTASIRYGRSGVARHVHHQTANAKVHVDITFPPPFSRFQPIFGKYETIYPAGHKKFADGRTDQSETYAILDFQAGKDVGLGMFGSLGSSVVSAGVRIAQFRSKDNVRLQAEPDVQYLSGPYVGSFFTIFPAWSAFQHQVPDFNDYTGKLAAKWSFRGLGPSVSWDASAAIAGNRDSGELTIDWGINAALLFGRQKAKVHTQTVTTHYHGVGYMAVIGTEGKLKAVSFLYETGAHKLADLPPHTTQSTNFDRSRTVTVPNLGGFAGLSMRYGDAKVSFGYRVDWFFNAIDAGIATRKSEDRGFYGPYASISIGLGN